MEVSGFSQSRARSLHTRSPVYVRSSLLRFQSDERLVGFIRRGHTAAFETLVARYEQRLFAFCRHLLGSHEDAEDVLQEVLAAAFKAMRADERPIHVRPWLYRIARNRSLNHLRRGDTGAFEQIDAQWSENGLTTADKVQQREEFRLLVGDIQKLPRAQRTALILREMNSLSYEQIATVMKTTVPSVKSLLVRARVSLSEAADARHVSCDQVRIELCEHNEDSIRRPSAATRRHLRTCERCTAFRSELRKSRRTPRLR
jgi:RNA polymerase sigma factor (sigma-70 family)